MRRSEFVRVPDAKWIQIVHGSNIANSFRVDTLIRISDASWPEGFIRPAQELIRNDQFNGRRDSVLNTAMLFLLQFEVMTRLIRACLGPGIVRLNPNRVSHKAGADCQEPEQTPG